MHIMHGDQFFSPWSLLTVTMKPFVMINYYCQQYKLNFGSHNDISLENQVQWLVGITVALKQMHKSMKRFLTSPCTYNNNNITVFEFTVHFSTCTNQLIPS